jgi:hypothetical protein
MSVIVYDKHLRRVRSCGVREANAMVRKKQAKPHSKSPYSIRLLIDTPVSLQGEETTEEARKTLRKVTGAHVPREKSSNKQTHPLRH